MLIFGDTRILKLIPKETASFQNIIYGSVKISGTQTFGTFAKDVFRQKHEDPFNIFLEILNTGSISSNKHEMDIWYFQLKELEQLKFFISVIETFRISFFN